MAEIRQYTVTFRSFPSYGVIDRPRTSNRWVMVFDAFTAEDALTQFEVWSKRLFAQGRPEVGMVTCMVERIEPGYPKHDCGERLVRPADAFDLLDFNLHCPKCDKSVFYPLNLGPVEKGG